jgi:hypothetical protein
MVLPGTDPFDSPQSCPETWGLNRIFHDLSKVERDSRKGLRRRKIKGRRGDLRKAKFFRQCGSSEPEKKNAPKLGSESWGWSNRPHSGEKGLWLYQPTSVMIVILFPIVLRLPAVLFAVPPLVIRIPATLPFGIQIALPVFRFTAMVATFLNRSIQSYFRLFDRVLALAFIIGAQPRFCHKKKKGTRQKGCHGCISKSSTQGFFLLIVFNLMSSFHATPSDTIPAEWSLASVYSVPFRNSADFRFCCPNVSIQFIPY